MRTTYHVEVVEKRVYNVIYEVEAFSEEEARELASIGEVEGTLDSELDTIEYRCVESICKASER